MDPGGVCRTDAGGRVDATAWSAVPDSGVTVRRCRVRGLAVCVNADNAPPVCRRRLPVKRCACRQEAASDEQHSGPVPPRRRAPAAAPAGVDEETHVDRASTVPVPELPRAAHWSASAASVLCASDVGSSWQCAAFDRAQHSTECCTSAQRDSVTECCARLHDRTTELGSLCTRSVSRKAPCICLPLYPASLCVVLFEPLSSPQCTRGMSEKRAHHFGQSKAVE